MERHEPSADIAGKSRWLQLHQPQEKFLMIPTPGQKLPHSTDRLLETAAPVHQRYNREVQDLAPNRKRKADAANDHFLLDTMGRMRPQFLHVPSRHTESSKLSPSQAMSEHLSSSNLSTSSDLPDATELHRRGDKLKAYPWQLKQKEDNLLQIYRTVALKWGLRSRTTNHDSIKKLGKYLEENPSMIEKILAGEEEAIDMAAFVSGPKHKKEGAHNNRFVQSLEDMLKMLRTRNHRTKPDTYTIPKWAPQHLKAADQKRLIAVLMREWDLTSDATLRNRLYDVGSEVIDQYALRLLSNDNGQVERAAANLLDEVNRHRRNTDYTERYSQERKKRLRSTPPQS